MPWKGPDISKSLSLGRVGCWRKGWTMRRTTFSYAQIEAFKDQWPCSGIPELDSITFEFADNGDLVDIVAMVDGHQVDSAEFDGPALLALSQEKGVDYV